MNRSAIVEKGTGYCMDGMIESIPFVVVRMMIKHYIAEALNNRPLSFVIATHRTCVSQKRRMLFNK